ncbi:potassium transporter TrkA [Streptomyces cinereoruber]|nr:NAD-binding protein [Streptomyces cinereoruber]PVC77732.1 potassium transporter TrkA [Streptomyces sp. CS081A]QEV37111.1 potassium transporter TrkA [Streptomyces cinereoruber]
MVVCGDDALAHRIAAELADVYRQAVTLVVPPPAGFEGAGSPPTSLSRASALLGRMSAAVGRPGGPPLDGADTGQGAGVREVTAAVPDAQVLAAVGVARAAALALLYEDDEANMRAAFLARRVNPRIRLVLRMYNRNLGRRMAELLDQATDLTVPENVRGRHDTSTVVLSDADTTAPALAATAVVGTRKIVQADGLLLRAAERLPSSPGDVAAPGLATLALLSSTTSDPAGAEGSDRSGPQAPQLLPDDDAVRAAAGRGTIVLEAVTHEPATPRRRTSRGASFKELLSRRLRWALAGVVAAVTVLAVVSSVITDESPPHAVYVTLLDLFAIAEPAVEESAPRQILQLLTGFVGLALLPLLVAGALEALGAYRSAAALRRPPRGLAGHVVLLGLGKIGTRVLAQLRELDIPVVCVEDDPDARGVALARSLRVPVVLGDVTQEGVLEAAKVHRAHALLALTSADTTNLEAALYARTLAPDLLVALRLYDDDFATAVYRTLRAAHPDALTRSRSVSTLAAPAFAAAMMGRQILGAIPVERRVLLFAALDVAGQPQLEGRTVREAFRPGAWRVLALDTTAPQARRPDLTAAHDRDDPPGLLWDLHAGYVLRPEDRVVIAATRAGLAELLEGSRTPSGRGR